MEAAQLATTNETVLEVRNLSMHLGNPELPVRAVDQVSFSIRRGETLALLGESGCGKSMTALSLIRLLPESGVIKSGDVFLGDEALLELSERDMRPVRGGRIGMIFQEPMTSLNPVMTIGEQIAESVRLHDQVSRNEENQRVIELLASVGIPDPERRVREYPHQMSGGMKQRVMIAIALAGRPDILIADEPTTALDVTIQAQVLDLLKELQQQTGMAILLITHDLGVVAEVADRVAVMYAGQIIETASVQQFFRTPYHPYSQKLFDSLPTRQKRQGELAVIKGTVPALTREFVQCRFIDRCYAKVEACQKGFPPWQGDTENGYRCYLHIDEQQTNKLDNTNPSGQIDPDESRLNEPLLSLSDLKVHFPIHKGVFKKVVGHVKAVDGLNITIAKGRTLALVGESGCGKTTVGKAVLQLIRPTGGSVNFEQTELTELTTRQLRPYRRALQIIFQDPASSMNPRMLVEDIVAEGMLAQGIGKTRQERVRIIEELLQRVGLSAEAMNRYPHEFSGGQRQRICIARSLAVNPRLIVCDEPTSALDVSVQAQILNLLKELQHLLGLSYLFITHDISVVSYLAHDVAVMYLGKIVEQGSVDDILDNPQHPYTRSLLSAVPVPDPEQRKEKSPRRKLEGDMPSPANPPSGCHFHPRCPDAMDICKTGYPEESRITGSHRVSCYLVK